MRCVMTVLGRTGQPSISFSEHTYLHTHRQFRETKRDVQRRRGISMVVSIDKYSEYFTNSGNETLYNIQCTDTTHR